MYVENFEAGAPGWAFQDLWSESFWHVSTTGGYSGQSYWCGIEELGGYDDIWQQTLTSPPISLSGTTAPVLTFMHHYRAEPRSGGYPTGFDAWDAMNVRLSTDGQNFTVIRPATGTGYQATSAYGFNLRFGAGVAGWAGNSGGWVAASFDLRAYAGQTVQIQFLFGSDEGFSHLEDAALFGWRVDNIKISDGATTIFQDDAGDSGATQFTADGPAGPNPWHLTTTAAASAPHSAGCFDTVTGGYLPGMKAALVSPAIAIDALPTDTQELTANFQHQGALDPALGASGALNFDLLAVEVRAYGAGEWNYWFAIGGTNLIPGSFHGYNDFNAPLDVSALIGADSVQFRIILLTQPDGEVVSPAVVFIDDFTLAAFGLDPIIGSQFGAFFTRVTAAPEQERSAIVDSFMATISSFPFVEHNTIAYYLYRGNANTINVPGDANGWNTGAFPMTRIAGTNLWFRQAVFEPDARLDYLFFLDRSVFFTDPLNPNRLSGYQGLVSELAMPDYVQPPEIARYANIPHGTLRTITIASTILRNTRAIRVYAPPEYATAVNDSFPVVLFHDGGDYISSGSAVNVLDYLISENRIQPVIAVFVPPVQRLDEYVLNLALQFESFIVNELMPMVDAQYRTKRDPGNRAMVGLSAGGLVATQICYNRPESFGLCGAFSPSYWANSMRVFDQVSNGPQKDIRFYIDWGTYEAIIMNDARAMRDNLVALGYNLTWNEWHEAHSFGSWRAHIDNALEYFFPGGVVSVKDNEILPVRFSLPQNYPNPFNPSTTISYDLPKSIHVELVIYNVLGKEVRRLVDAKEMAGHHHIAWDGKDWAGATAASGVYVYRIKAGEFERTRKLILVR
ncbi:MAG: alpha/beta hydrolase-fold protein [bacterium]